MIIDKKWSIELIPSLLKLSDQELNIKGLHIINKIRNLMDEVMVPEGK